MYVKLSVYITVRPSEPFCKALLLLRGDNIYMLNENHFPLISYIHFSWNHFMALPGSAITVRHEYEYQLNWLSKMAKWGTL